MLVNYNHNQIDPGRISMKLHDVSLVVVGAFALLASASAASADSATNSSALRDAVTLENIRAHQQALQAIANANGGTRVASSAGHDQSADYVANLLQNAGYNVTLQEFKFPLFQETATPVFERLNPPVSYQSGTDFFTMEYSGSGDVTAAIQPTNDIVIPPGAKESTSNSGCEPGDFPASTAGGIALVQRGTCTFFDKARNAEAAGAVGVIIFNEGQPGRTETLNGTLGEPSIGIPVVGTSFDIGSELYAASQSGSVEVHLVVQATTEIRTTRNVIAETTTGRSDRIVVVGAHLDSVAEGPGINDNGSGSAAILEIAIQMAEIGIQPYNKVRFAFWSAEEAGLLGSEYYVGQLTSQQAKNIALNLNFDMLGSPNFVRFVYDGDGSATGTAGPNGSKNIEKVFLDYFATAADDVAPLATEPTAFDGRSDYGPFIAVGIPAGGLFSGAEGIKTAEEAEVYGGTAGVAYDPCYHQACDDVGNNSDDSLNQLTDAAAHAVLNFAMTTSAVNGTSKAQLPHTGAVDPASLLYRGSHLQK
jgi:Zn-dependent M28 family amino/carboxypeptidase